MGLKTFPGGIHTHDYKNLSKHSAIEKIAKPSKVIIPLSQHIGAPSEPIVKVGDQVKAGQVIAEPKGFVSIYLHASISGKISKIADFPHPTGTIQKAIEITASEEDEMIELVDDDPTTISAEEMRSRVQQAGICGMGGAGFPTHVKLSPPKEKPIDTIILNGVECEPYLTADHRMMLEKTDEIIEGLKLFMKIADAKEGVIGIEANKPDVIKLMKQKTKNIDNIRILGLKLKYPQGAEKQLIYAATKRCVPNKGGLPMDVGVIVQNVGTAYAIYEAIRYKKPLIERVITVSGSVVKNPKNILAPIGTRFSDLVEHCGGTSEETGKVISGGPMMGFAIPDLDSPMIKGSSGLLLLNKKEAQKEAEHTCIRCGGCVDVCPMNLVPSMIAQSVRYDQFDLAERYGVMDCIKCGCCAFVCPAHIKLIQWIDIGKLKVNELKQA